MKKRFLQPALLNLLYKGICHHFLKLVVGVQFSDCRFLQKEKQFILIANHNSHLDTLSLLSSLPGNLLHQVKPVAAQDYFGRNKLQAAFSNYFINTLLISRKGVANSAADPMQRMLDAIDEGYSLILFPEGTRGKPEQMSHIKSGIARLLLLRPHVTYIPVFMAGMGRSLPKGGTVILPYKASIHYGRPTLISPSDDVHSIVRQITEDFEQMHQQYHLPTSEEDDS